MSHDDVSHDDVLPHEVLVYGAVLRHGRLSFGGTMFAQGPVLAASSNSFGGGGVADGLGCFLGNSGGVSAFTVNYVSGTGSPTSP